MRRSDAIIVFVKFHKLNSFSRARAEVGVLFTLLLFMIIDFSLVVYDLALVKRFLRHFNRLFTAFSRACRWLDLIQPEGIGQRVVTWTGLVRIDASFTDHGFSEHLFRCSSSQYCVDVWIVVGRSYVCHLLLIVFGLRIVSFCLLEIIARLLMYCQLTEISTKNRRGILSRRGVCFRQI